MKSKSLASFLAIAVVASGAAALLTSCQSTGPKRTPGQVIQDTHRNNMERHRSFHERMADHHEKTFGVRPPTPPGMRSSSGY